MAPSSEAVQTAPFGGWTLDSHLLFSAGRSSAVPLRNQPIPQLVSVGWLMPRLPTCDAVLLYTSRGRYVVRARVCRKVLPSVACWGMKAAWRMANPCLARSRRAANPYLARSRRAVTELCMQSFEARTCTSAAARKRPLSAMCACPGPYVLRCSCKGTTGTCCAQRELTGCGARCLPR